MSKTFGTPGGSARQQAENLRRRREELERLQQREGNWGGGAVGEESTGATIEKRCPSAVALHDRRMPDSRANIDHIVLVPSGVWVIDSKRMKGRIKVEDAKDGTQKLIIHGNNQTELVHKLTGQVNAVKAVMAELDLRVPVYGGFCFWLPIESKRDLLDPRIEDNGLPLLRTWTINGYPLFYPRQMARRLNSAGTLSAKHAEELGAALAERFPSALDDEHESGSAPTMRRKAPLPPSPRPSTPSAAPVGIGPSPTDQARLSKEEYKAQKEAEQTELWERQRPLIEEALDGPVPAFLADRLRSDGAIWCHHSLWHCRTYLVCVRGRVGGTFAYAEAASVVAALHPGRTSTPQWRALTAFLEHLRSNGIVDFASDDRRIDRVSVLADPTRSPQA